MRLSRSIGVTAALHVGMRDPYSKTQLADLEIAAIGDGVRFQDFDLRRPDHRAACRNVMTAVGMRKRGWSREVARRYAVALVKMWAKDGPGVPHRLGSSQVEALGAMRAMGAGAAVRSDERDEVAERKARNRRKRERKGRAA